MTRQALLNKLRSYDLIGLLPKEYCKPSKDLEMVFNNEHGELESGQGNRPNHNIVILY